MSTEKMDETDPRYLEPFVAGMQAARFALVKHGWTSDAPLTVAEVVAIIDRERAESVRLVVKARAEEATAQREAVPGMPMEGPYPGTVDEVADEIARFVLERENGPARGVARRVFSRLAEWQSNRDEEAAVHRAEANLDEVF